MLKLILVVVLFFASAVAEATPIATVSNLVGMLHVIKSNGDNVLLGKGSMLDEGDTVTTGKDSFARFKLLDGAEMTLRPETSIKFERYNFVESKPVEDSLVFNLIKGGFRMVTGLISKRGDKRAFKLQTVTSIIGIRGTDFFTRHCAGDSCRGKKQGTYTHTKDGSISLANQFGEIACDAGESCFSSDNEAPSKGDAATDDVAPFDLPLPFLDEAGTDGGNSGLGSSCILRG